MSVSPIQFNTIACIKKLRDANFTQIQAEAFAEVVESQSQMIHDQQTEINSLKARGGATSSDVKESELRLQKEIEVVRKEIVIVQNDSRESELRLQAEIEKVRKEIVGVKSEIKETELRLQKEIWAVRGDVKGLEIKMLMLYGGGFIALLGILAKGFHWL